MRAYYIVYPHYPHSVLFIVLATLCLGQKNITERERDGDSEIVGRLLQGGVKYIYLRLN